MCHGCGVDQDTDPYWMPICKDPECRCTFFWMNASGDRVKHNWVWAVNLPLCAYCSARQQRRIEESLAKLGFYAHLTQP